MLKTGHKPTLRVLDILKYLSIQPDGLTLTEISEKMKSPKSTIVPILHTMTENNFIEYDDALRKYSIGINTYVTGNTYLQNHSMIDIIQNEMYNIVKQCNEICQLGILEGKEVLYIAKVDSPNPIRLISSIGSRLPAYATSLGKSLLSLCTLDELKRLYPDGLKPLTKDTIISIDKLYDQLQIVKKTSIAIECSETHPDISCISTPLIKGNKVIAAVSVSIPNFRYNDEKRQQISNILLESKKRLEKLLKRNDLLFI